MQGVQIMIETIFDDEIAQLEWQLTEAVALADWEQSQLAIRHYISQGKVINRVLLTGAEFTQWEAMGKMLTSTKANSALAQKLEKIAIVTDLPTFDVGHTLREQYPEAEVFIYCQEELVQARQWLTTEASPDAVLKPQPT